MKKFPAPLPFWKLLGPSFIILALGLGSGEVILWPYLVSNYGLGIAWGALLGITFQYFMNMEIERYALVKGESVFVGLSKMFKKAPYWFILSTFIGFGIPGIIAASAKVFCHIIGIQNFKWAAIIFLLTIGLILSSSKTVYTRMEKITKFIILIGAPFILILAIILSSPADWTALGQGLIGKGDGFSFLPIGIGLAAFLAAFAYSGAGGNLNLTQSIYIKEKGYGMGKYAQKISGLFRSKTSKKIKLTGEDFNLNKPNLENFRVWWKRISLEHLIVFWFIGLVTMSMLMLLAFTTTYNQGTPGEGINFVINEGTVIGQSITPIIGLIFLIVITIMLFQTQLGVLDSTSRIMSENWALKKIKNKESKINLSKIYFVFLWAQIAFGIILFLLNIYEPLFLIVLGAVINAIAMFVHVGMVNWMNHKTLPKQVQAGWIRKLIIIIIFIFLGVFSAVTLWDKFF